MAQAGHRASAEAPAGRREQRRLQHHGLSRTQLLDAAEDVFGRKGFYETTLKEVAELAEFSVGSVYSFFESKDDLFRQIFIRRGGEFMAAMREVLAGDEPPSEQLRRLVDFQVGFFRQRPHFGRLFLRYSSSTAMSVEHQIDEAIAANYAESMALQADLFRRGQVSGDFRSGDPAVLGRLYSGLIAAYHAMDPAVVSDEPVVGEALPVASLHEIVRSAFGS